MAAIVLSVSALGLPQGGHAQSFSPVAVVNDQIITGYDVQQRALLNATTRGGQPDANAALDELITDMLRIQAAKRAGIDPTQEQVRAGFEEIARLNERDPAEMRRRLLSRGISNQALDNQVKAEVAWREFIVARYGSRARVSERELEAAVESSPAAATNAAFSLAQLVIGLAPDAPQDAANAALARATGVRSQISSCDDIVRRQSEFLPISGLLGEMTLDAMPGPVREAVGALAPGQITPPVRSNDGFHLIMVCDKRSAGPGTDRLRAQAGNQLRAKRLERYANSLLRELKREAVIERR